MVKEFRIERVKDDAAVAKAIKVHQTIVSERRETEQQITDAGKRGNDWDANSAGAQFAQDLAAGADASISVLDVATAEAEDRDLLLSKIPILDGAERSAKKTLKAVRGSAAKRIMSEAKPELDRRIRIVVDALRQLADGQEGLNDFRGQMQKAGLGSFLSSAGNSANIENIRFLRQRAQAMESRLS